VSLIQSWDWERGRALALGSSREEQQRVIGKEIEEDELQQEQGWGIGSRRRRAGAARLHLQEMDLPPLPRQLLHRPALHQQVRHAACAPCFNSSSSSSLWLLIWCLIWIRFRGSFLQQSHNPWSYMLPTRKFTDKLTRIRGSWAFVVSQP